MLGPEEIAAVTAVLESGMVTQGAQVAGLEAGFAKHCGTSYAVAFNSGTAALHTALHAAKVGPGDEVIVPPFSFIATINPVLMQGATPVLADIGADDFNLDPAKVEAVVGPKTKAIIAVDLYGQPYDYDAIQAIAAKHNLVVIEDACQAAGAEYRGKPAGSLGDYGCLSLYATKNITSAEGGILTTNSEAADRAARAFRQHGMTAPFEYDGVGYNYRSTDIAAAIGREQLKKLERFVKARQENARLLSAGLSGIAGLILPRVIAGRTHSFHQYTVRVTKDFGMSRAILKERLKRAGVASQAYYPKPLHAYAHVASSRYRAGDFPVAEQAAREVLSLPVHPGLSRADVGAIIEAVKAAQYA